MAIASQRSVYITLSHSFIDQSFTHASDDLWANRIIVHCAKVVQFCFGDATQRPEDYHALREYDDGWLRTRPPSFLPIAYSASDLDSGEVFPRIMYLNHAVGT